MLWFYNAYGQVWPSSIGMICLAVWVSSHTHWTHQAKTIALSDHPASMWPVNPTVILIWLGSCQLVFLLCFSLFVASFFLSIPPSLIYPSGLGPLCLPCFLLLPFRGGSRGSITHSQMCCCGCVVCVTDFCFLFYWAAAVVRLLPPSFPVSPSPGFCPIKPGWGVIYSALTISHKVCVSERFLLLFLVWKHVCSKPTCCGLFFLVTAYLMSSVSLSGTVLLHLCSAFRFIWFLCSPLLCCPRLHSAFLTLSYAVNISS